ncbi:hypothetical protein [Dokdonia sp.]|uniref:hypothetical protein n=1 Tax=Dokdonia sp. TaxID=2024995 RepID=UPI003263DE31
MPKLDIENPYSRRSYYFGVIALISFLVISLLQGVKRITDTKVPIGLFITILVVCVFCGLACIYTIIKAKNEIHSFKKVIAVILAMASFVYILLLIKELISPSLN